MDDQRLIFINNEINKRKEEIKKLQDIINSYDIKREENIKGERVVFLVISTIPISVVLAILSPYLSKEVMIIILASSIMINAFFLGATKTISKDELNSALYHINKTNKQIEIKEAEIEILKEAYNDINDPTYYINKISQERNLKKLTLKR